MGVGGSSPAAGSSCSICLRKFIVNFRVSDIDDNKVINGKTINSDYDGTFGFDWLRDEYIYPIMPVDGKNIKPVYRGNPFKLITEYQKGQKTKIKPFGEQYIPSWLTIFPRTNSSKINYNGVSLNLELLQCLGDDASPLDNDGTKLFFLPTNKSLKILPDNIDLGKIIQKQRKSKFLGNKTRFFYEYKNSIKIFCATEFNEHEEINVYAIKGATNRSLS